MADSNTCKVCGESTPLPYFCRRCWRKGSHYAHIRFYKDMEKNNDGERPYAKYAERIS